MTEQEYEKRVSELLRLADTSDPNQRNCAGTDLKTMDRSRLGPVLRSLLRSGDLDWRWRAAEATAVLDPAAFQDDLMAALEDSHPGFRWHVCGLLFDVGTAAAAPAITRVLETNPCPEVRLIPACALGRLGDVSCVPALQRVATHDTGEDDEGRKIRDAARKAIGEIHERMPKVGTF